MKKAISIVLFIAAILLGWVLLSTASVVAVLTTLPQGGQLALAIVTLVVMVVWAWTINPYLGEYIFRLGIYLIVLTFDKNAKFEPPVVRGGSGSGRSGRGN